MRTAACLLLCLAASADTTSDLARDFLNAFRARDQGRQAVLAAKAAGTADYALVVHALADGGHMHAAAALAKMRGGPERDGLARLIKTLRAGLLPTRAQVRALARARSLLGSDPGAALRALEGAGAPVDGTVMAAEILWIKAQAAPKSDRGRLFGRCARYANSIGWLSRARDAHAARLALASGAEALEAADGLVAVLESLDLRDALMIALAQRARLRIAQGMGKQGRADYMRAVNLAKQRKKPFVEARLWSELAFIFHAGLHQPREALKFYKKSLALLRGLAPKGDRKVAHIHRQTRFNVALVLTDLARYGKALERLDALWEEQERLSPVLARRVMAQRAYVFRRLSRVQSSKLAYEQALELAPEGPEREALRLELGKLEFVRGDLRAAEAQLEMAAASIDTLAARGAVRAMRGKGKQARADFAAALARAKGPVQQAQVLLKRAVAERAWGRVAEARVTAARALKLFIESVKTLPEEQHDYGNTAVAYVLLGELLLLEGRYEEAEKTVLAAAAVFFYRLKDAARAVPAYARWTLTLIALGRADDALKRMQVLSATAQGTPDDGLKSIAKRVEAIYETRGQRADDAARLFGEALELAPDAERKATALVHLALVDKDVEHVRRALALLDAQRLDGPRERPVLEGEHSGFAASIGAALTKDVDEAFGFIERARAERLLVALRGRAAVLDAALPEPLHAAYVGARAGLMEARAAKQGVAEAEQAFDEMVAELRARAPHAAALAFPRPPVLEEVKRALRADEALLVMLDDPYARLMVAVTQRQAVVRAYDIQKPLEAVHDLIGKKKKKGKNAIQKLIVAPDGLLSLDLTPFGKQKAIEVFEIFYVPSGASFLRLRALPPPTGKGAGVLGEGPKRLVGSAAQGQLELFHIGTPWPVDLSFGQATRTEVGKHWPADTVVLANAVVRRGPLPRVDGLAAAAAALFMGESRQLVVSLVGPPPLAFWDRFYAACLDNGMTPAFALLQARRWIRPRSEQFWGGVVIWGAP